CLAPSIVLAQPSVDRVARQVDRLIAEELFDDQTELAPQIDDATFLRRVWLDLVGDVPSPEHTAVFLLDLAPDKGARVIRDLLASEQYGQNGARYCREVILTRRIEDRTETYEDLLWSLINSTEYTYRK